MSLKVRNYAVTVGSPLPNGLSQATNEDTQHVMTFTDAVAPLGTGNPVDLTTVASVTLTIKDANGQQLAQVVGAVIDVPTAKVGFTLLHGAIAAATPQPYSADVLLIDQAGNQNQLLVVTPFSLLKGLT